MGSIRYIININFIYRFCFLQVCLLENLESHESYGLVLPSYAVSGELSILPPIAESVACAPLAPPASLLT